MRKLAFIGMGLLLIFPAFAQEELFSKRILFGDLHVHTTYSFDSVLMSLPVFGGEGSHPPDDACDFARFCSQLDFFSVNDHAESITPSRWKKTKKSIRSCNAHYGNPDNPQLLAYTGWEWTQTGETPETHYGHKNVIFLDTAEDKLPTRPISALGDKESATDFEKFMASGLKIFKPLAHFWSFADLLSLMGDLATLKNCPPGEDPRKTPTNCRENAQSPDALFNKLDRWGADYIVIPHGVTWGVHAPPGSKWDNQLNPADHRPDRQLLLEVYSGHGAGEQFKSYSEGEPECSPPTANYYPCCWRAGEIMRSRCGNLSAAQCDTRVEEAKRLALLAQEDPYAVFPDTKVSDWLDCDQCRGCFKPAFNYRPKESAQYSLAVSDFDHRDASGRPLRFEFGFISSSDNHTARAGTGYKQFARRYMTDTHSNKSEWFEDRIHEWTGRTQEDPQKPQARKIPGRLLDLLDVERGTSFLYLGGLVAVHASEKSRESVWDGLKHKEVYGTSGPRILLWFYLMNGRGGVAPMGSKVQQRENPRFRVRAAGSFVQKPGCPEDSIRHLGSHRLEKLCRGECYNPGDQRRAIRSIEVIRVRPQKFRGEPIAPLIEDPWRTFNCEPGREYCEVEFEDPEFASIGRDTAYYVRALEEPSLAVNGGNYRVEFKDGVPMTSNPCSENHRSPDNDDCLWSVNERAWSSPIFVNWE